MDDQQVSDNTFGLFIAYVLPGFTALYGLPVGAASQTGWSAVLTVPSPNVTELVLMVLQAVAVGLTVSAVRWLTVDTLHHRTGLRAPSWNSAAVRDGVHVLEFLIQIHYRYYKFYSNMVVALVASLVARGTSLDWGGVLCHACLVALFLIASRDALQKYYARSAVLFESHLPSDHN